MSRTIGLALTGILAGTFAFLSIGLFSPTVEAIPAFARKTGLSCSACHEVWPRLNGFGISFRDRGYRLKRDRDAPIEQDPSYWPIAFRTTAGYQYARSTLVPTDAKGPVTTQTGTFGFTGLDVWTAGTLGDKLSFAITYTPGLGSAGFQLNGNGAGGDLESAWLGYNDVLENWLNFRVGKHALDLPIDEHRQITLTSGYNVYHFRPQGTAVSFQPGNNQAGLEMYGHSDNSRVRYSVSLVNERDSAFFSNNAVSNPVVWGHFTAEQYLDNSFLAAVKAGVFGSVGWHPTSGLTCTPAAAGAPGPGCTPSGAVGANNVLQGSGARHARHASYGAEAHLQFLSTANPLTLTGIIWGNTQERPLIANATRDARWLGGLVEGVYTINPRLSLIGRYEQIRTTRGGDPTQPKALGDLTSYTGAIRHTYELTSRTEAALQLEVTRLRTDAGNGTAPEQIVGLAAADFTF
ncbi:MAG: hypothetical protein NVS4B10_03050 [Myxococcales bacterium]